MFLQLGIEIGEPFQAIHPEPHPEPGIFDDDVKGTVVKQRPPYTSGRAQLWKTIIFLGLCIVVYLLDSAVKTEESEIERTKDGGKVRKPKLAGENSTIIIPLTRQRIAMQSGSEIMYYKIAYYGALELGTPAQAFSFVFDTGSGHLVVPSSYCHSESCKLHKRYRRSLSKSAIDIDHDGTAVGPDSPRDQLTVQFGTGEVTGVFIEEEVCVGESLGQRHANDGTAGPLTSIQPPTASEAGCMRMRILAATDMSSDPFKTFKFDGILGLGLDSLSRTPEFNFMNALSGRMQDLGANNAQVFAMFLGEEGEESDIEFGGWSENRVRNGVTWNSVVNPEHGHWMINIKSIRVNDEVLQYCDEGCKAVVDSGTTLVSVPSAIFPDVFELLRHDGPQSGICEGRGPQWHIELEHFTITLDAEDYSVPEWYTDAEYPPEFGGRSNVVIGEDGYGPTRSDVFCRPMLMTMDIPEPVGPKLIILGEPVLRKYYTVYDMERLRVGFGLANHSQAQVVAPTDDGHDDESWWYEDEEDDFL